MVELREMLARTPSRGIQNLILQFKIANFTVVEGKFIFSHEALYLLVYTEGQSDVY